MKRFSTEQCDHDVMSHAVKNTSLTFSDYMIYYSQRQHFPQRRAFTDLSPDWWSALNVTQFITAQQFNTLTERKIKINKTIPAATLNSNVADTFQVSSRRRSKS